MPILPSIFIGLVVCSLLIRTLFVIYMKKCWHEVCLLYILSNIDSRHDLDKYIETWPLYMMILYIWDWNFKSFIVNQEEMTIILDFFREQFKVKG